MVLDITCQLYLVYGAGHIKMPAIPCLWCTSTCQLYLVYGAHQHTNYTSSMTYQHANYTSSMVHINMPTILHLWCILTCQLYLVCGTWPSVLAYAHASMVKRNTHGHTTRKSFQARIVNPSSGHNWRNE